MVGQEHIVRTISNQIKLGEVAHAYLFTGPRGTGKTTVARLIAKSLNCEKRKKESEPCNECSSCLEVSGGRSLDLIEIDAASNRGIDEIRELREKVRFSPTQGRYKIYIIDEVHMLTKEAFNALLKTLEEPPLHAVFILATTEASKIPSTIISRTQRFDFRKLSVEEITSKLREIADSEKVYIDPVALNIIALHGDGCMRDAISTLGQVMSVEDKKITLEEVESILGKSSFEAVSSLVGLMPEKKLHQAVVLVGRLLEDGFDLLQFNKELIKYLRKILLIKITADSQEQSVDTVLESGFTKEQVLKIIEQSKQLTLDFIVKAIKAFSQAEAEIKVNIFPQLPLELALVELLHNHDEDQNREEPVPQKQEVKILEKKEPPKKEEAKTEIKKDENISTVKASVVPQAGGTDIEAIKSSWPEIITEVKPRNYSAAAFLKPCVPLGVKDGLLYVVTKFDFHKEKLNEQKTRFIIEEVLQNKLGQKLLLRLVNPEEANNLGYNVYTEDPEEKAVSEAIDIFGGEVLEG